MKVALSAALWFAIGACSQVAFAPASASAQDRPAHTRRAKRERPAKQRASREPRHARGEHERAARRKARAARREEARARRAPAPLPAASAPGAATGGEGAEIVREGDTSVKVMHFSGLDIEGRLKSPQLLVFVERVRAEFEQPALPHRSFLPELRDTAALLRSRAEEPRASTREPGR